MAGRLAALQARNLGLRTLILTGAREMNLVWSLRKAGLSLLTGCKGAAKPVAFIEDAAVRPAQLPDYVEACKQSCARSAWRPPITVTPRRDCCTCGRCSICTARTI